MSDDEYAGLKLAKLINPDAGSVTVSLTLNAGAAHALAALTVPWVRIPDPGDPAAPVRVDAFTGGTVLWCETAADALLLQAYEQGYGHKACLLTVDEDEDDLEAEGYDHEDLRFAVVSSRRFAETV